MLPYISLFIVLYTKQQRIWLKSCGYLEIKKTTLREEWISVGPRSFYFRDNRVAYSSNSENAGVASIFTPL